MLDTDLTGDSKNWGNYIDSSFLIENGQYTKQGLAENPNSFKAYTESTSGYVENSTKLKNSGVVLTTGATKINMRMNIYDLAGNVAEWTLEKNSRTNYSSCVHRGSYYGSSGTITVLSGFNSDADKSTDYVGLRPALY